MSGPYSRAEYQRWVTRNLRPPYQLQPPPYDEADKPEKTFQDIEQEIAQDQEALWNTMTKADQLRVFCCIMRRLVQAELVDRGTYRYVLYQVFGFGQESYMHAQLAGFLELHNSIYARDHDARLLQAIRKQIQEQLPLKSGYSIYDGGFEDGKQAAIKVLEEWNK